MLEEVEMQYPQLLLDYTTVQLVLVEGYCEQ